MRRGFTLVELSIVLVIIGLLVGGILAAQSMINTARTQNMVKQLSQYDVAIANFITKYNGLPGDKSGVGTCDAGEACGDGFVGAGSAYELGFAWQALSLGVGLKNKKGNNFGTWDTFGPTTEDNCPKFDIPQNEDAKACLLVAWPAWMSGVGIYMYYESNYSVRPTIRDPLRPVDALALDQKIDDGLAVSPFPKGISSITAGSTPVGNCVSGTAYDVNNSNYACSLFIEIGIYTGVNTK